MPNDWVATSLGYRLGFRVRASLARCSASRPQVTGSHTTRIPERLRKPVVASPPWTPHVSARIPALLPSITLGPERDVESHACARASRSRAGATLLTEGDFGFAMFAITAGTAEVLQNGVVMRSLGPGDVFGEIAVLSGGRRTATVVASTPMQPRHRDQPRRLAAGTRGSCGRSRCSRSRPSPALSRRQALERLDLDLEERVGEPPGAHDERARSAREPSSSSSGSRAADGMPSTRIETPSAFETTSRPSPSGSRRSSTTLIERARPPRARAVASATARYGVLDRALEGGDSGVGSKPSAPTPRGRDRLAARRTRPRLRRCRGLHDLHGIPLALARDARDAGLEPVPAGIERHQVSVMRLLRPLCRAPRARRPRPAAERRLSSGPRGAARGRACHGSARSGARASRPAGRSPPRT